MASEQPFPTARWWDFDVEFVPGDDANPGSVTAVVVFAFHADGFVLADIPERGWCVPSGRPEPGEFPVDTAIRETAEEVGAELLEPKLIGEYVLSRGDGQRSMVPAFVGRVEKIGPLPPGSESRGVRIVKAEELPGIYWLWDPLMERMFDFALARYHAGCSQA